MAIENVSQSLIFGGLQQRYSHYSDVLNCEMHFSIYLPELNPTHNIPVIYWLSGLTCTDENFVLKAGAQRYASECGVALAAPDTSPRGENIPDDPANEYDFGLGAGFYLNATQEPWSKNYQMYDYVTRELPALINENFPVDPSRKSIMGHSMGGHGALTIALKNPDSFHSVSAFSPIVAPTQVPWGQKAFELYLGKDRQTWKKYDSCELILASQKHVPMLIDQGMEDSFLETQLRTDLLEDACQESDYDITIRRQPGYDHSYFFIASFIESHIVFHKQCLS